MGFGDWRGWQRLDELDRRSGFGPDGWSRRPWVGIAAAVALVALWFLKALTIESSLGEALLSVALAVGIIVLASLGGLAVERWLSGQIGDGPDESGQSPSNVLAGDGEYDAPGSRHIHASL